MVIVMSTENNRTVKNIFDAIKSSKGLKKDSELAKMVSTSKQNIFNWQKRNNIGDYEVFTRAGFSEHYMRTGDGPMFAGTINQPEAHINIPSAEINAEPIVTSNTEINVHKGVMMTTKVLSSKTGYANALWHNLMAFDAAVEKEERVKELEKKVDLLLEKMERMERAVVTPGEVDKKREATG